MESLITPSLLKTILDEGGAGVWIIDTDLNVLYANEKFANMVGIPVSEVIGKSLLDYIPEFRHPIVCERFQKALAGQSTDQEGFLKRVDGTVLPVVAGLSPVRKDGKIVAISAFISDISELKTAQRNLSELSQNLERKVQDRTESLLRIHGELQVEIEKKEKVEEELRRSKEELDGFFQTSPMRMGIVEISPEGLRQIYHNEAAGKAFNSNGSALRSGMLYRDLGCPTELEQLYIDWAQETLQTKLPTRREMQDPQNGRYVSVLTNFIGYGPSGNPRICYIGEDVTDRIKAEAEREEQNRQFALMRKMSALGEMSAGIAHEIFNPVTIIKGFADLLARRAKKGTVTAEEATKIAEEVVTTCKRITSIVDGLKFFSRGGPQEPIELVPLKTVIQKTVQISGERFRSAGVEIIINGITDQMIISCRPAQICQVFLNLFNNAYDAMKNSSTKIIKIEARNIQNEIELKISDTGPGIPESNHEKIFEPFFTTKGVGKGTGLGLSICRGILEAHNAKIELIHQPITSHGATFKLNFPHITELPIYSGKAYDRNVEA